MSSTQETPSSGAGHVPNQGDRLPFWATAVLTGGGAIWMALHLRAYAALALAPLGVPGADPGAQVPGVLDAEQLVLGPVGLALVIALVVSGVLLRLRDRNSVLAVVGALWLLPILGGFAGLSLPVPALMAGSGAQPSPEMMGMERLALGPAGGLMLAAILIAGIIVRMPDRAQDLTLGTGTDQLSRDQETL